MISHSTPVARGAAALRDAAPWQQRALLGVAFVALLCLLYRRRGPLVPNPELWLLQVAAAIGVILPFVYPRCTTVISSPGRCAR